MKRRRIVLALLALGVVPVAVEAQQARRTALVGVTMAGSPTNPFIGPLRAGLNELGWIEGNNMRLEVRYAEGQPQRYRDFMAEFVRLKVDVIVSGGGTTAARAAMQATTTIPIVVPVSVDPVGTGLVASLAEPGGNVTALSMLAPEISAKRVQLIKELLPKATRVAVLLDPAVDGRTEEFREAFEAAVRSGSHAIVVLSSSFFNAHRRRLIELAEQAKLPAVYEHREFSDSGGLMSYGPRLPDMYRRAATYVDKILRGARPASLPVEQPTTRRRVDRMIGVRARWRRR